MELSAAKILRIYKRSKKELVESLEELLDPQLAHSLPAAMCSEGIRILEEELLPEGVLGDLAALKIIQWEGELRPELPSPSASFTIAMAISKCASERGMPASMEELEKIAEESEVEEL